MKILKRIIVINIIAFLAHFSTLAMENLPSEGKRIYFYRIEAPTDNPLHFSHPLYLLGGCHVVPITALPAFVQETFEKCSTFVTECSEISLPNYFAIHLDNMKKLGYPVTPENLLQIEFESKQMTFCDEEYKQRFCDEFLQKYSVGWTEFLKQPQALKDIAASHNLNIENINSTHPKAVLYGILETLITREKEKEGMDNYFLTQASANNKLIIGLETDFERAELHYKPQLDAPPVLSLEYLFELIDNKLEYLLNISSPDNKKFIKEEILHMTNLYLTKEIEKELDESKCKVKERNIPWFPKYKGILTKADGPIFSSVGLNHIKGIISFMQNEGCRITQATSEGFN